MFHFNRKLNEKPDGFHCPVCGLGAERVHRNMLDRWVSIFRTVHRYRCGDPACGWHGLLGRDSEDDAVPRTTWHTRVAWFIIGAAAALMAVQGERLYMRSRTILAPLSAVQQGTELTSQATPPGVDFDGEALPATDARIGKNPSPLNLRRNCAWGEPGGNRYRGTAEQALSAAQLPPDVVRKISDMVERGWNRGQVEISRNGIFTLDHRRNFGKAAVSMAFGNSLCFNMRVNFKPGHMEYAALYEVIGDDRKPYTVMVPDVCQNVAVLGERYDSTEDDHKVPEPATWALLSLALGVLALLRWHSKRSGGK